MSVAVLDSRIFRDLFGTQEIRDAFSDEAYARQMIEVEAALARAESRVGVIPAEAGQAITKALQDVKLDFSRLSSDTEIVGYPVLPLIRQLSEQTPPDMAKFIHWGATTQDIMDTATILQVRAALPILTNQLYSLAKTLRSLSLTHRSTPMPGRTHLQHALPITFGYKCAICLSSIHRHLERLPQIAQRLLHVSFGGAAGTLASLSSTSPSIALQVRSTLAKELNLSAPPITWHSTRDNIAELLSFLALVGGSLGKLAHDITILSSNEVSEVSEPFVPHRGASSTMPQKRNPISSEIILAASKMLREKASLGLDAVVHDFERATGPWHLEWAAVPEAFTLAVGALHQTNFMMGGGLVVHAEKMMQNLLLSKGLIVGEAVMMGLAESIGRQAAHDVVYEACKKAIEGDEALLDVLTRENREVVEKVGEEKLRELCDATRYLGACREMVDEVLKADIDQLVEIQ